VSGLNSGAILYCKVGIWLFLFSSSLEFAMAFVVWSGLLCHRNDALRWTSLRYGHIWYCISSYTKTGRCYDCCRDGNQ